jgi:hypothetical protein
MNLNVQAVKSESMYVLVNARLAILHTLMYATDIFDRRLES